MDQVLHQQKQARLACIFQSLQQQLGDISLAEFLEYARSKQVADQESEYFAELDRQSEDAMTVIQAQRIS